MKYSFFFIFLIASTTGIFAQDRSSQNKNVVMLDAAGPIVAGVGIGYERYVNLHSRFKPTARAGVGLVNSFRNVTGYVGSSLLWGGTSNMELGVNYLFQYDRWVFNSSDEDDLQFRNDFQLIVGYRYQARKGFLFRLYWVAPLGCCGSWIPAYGGIGLGQAF